MNEHALGLSVAFVALTWLAIGQPRAHAIPNYEARQATALESIAKSLKAIERKKCD